MTSAYEKVMDSRRELVEQFIARMEQGNIPWKRGWSRDALCYYNPISDCRYRGGNRLRLLSAVLEKGYQDPRWMTFKQAQAAGLQVRKGAKGVLCEKWIFTQEKTVLNEQGEKVKETVKLDRPKVSYFIVFNGEEIEGIPPVSALNPDIEDDVLADRLISVSECPVREMAQGKACYVPSEDVIWMPPRQMFSGMAEFNATLLHEMGHSTGHPSRLGRKIENKFGTPEYAREELRAELSSAFCGAELGIDSGTVDDNHAAYLQSWIQVLRKDPNELFRAAADAEMIADRIMGHYRELYPQEEYMQHIDTVQQASLDRPAPAKNRSRHL